jgi:hypothetical protein
VSSKYEEYHRTADHCLQMALNAADDNYRASWLRLAQGWLQMIPSDQIKIGEWRVDVIRAKAKDTESIH